MTRWPASAVVLLTILSAGRAAEPRPVPRYDARTFFATTAHFGASFSADEKHILITSDASGVFNAASVPVEGGPPQALTHSKASAIMGVSYFPEDGRVIYTQDEGGNELNHVYVREADGKVRDLT